MCSVAELKSPLCVSSDFSTKHQKGHSRTAFNNTTACSCGAEVTWRQVGQTACDDCDGTFQRQQTESVARGGFKEKKKKEKDILLVNLFCVPECWTVVSACQG